MSFLSQYNNESISWIWRKRFLIKLENTADGGLKQRKFGQFVSTQYGNMALFISKEPSLYKTDADQFAMSHGSYDLNLGSEI